MDVWIKVKVPQPLTAADQRAIDEAMAAQGFVRSWLGADGHPRSTPPCEYMALGVTDPDATAAMATSVASRVCPGATARWL